MKVINDIDERLKLLASADQKLSRIEITWQEWSEIKNLVGVLYSSHKGKLEQIQSKCQDEINLAEVEINWLKNLMTGG